LVRRAFKLLSQVDLAREKRWIGYYQWNTPQFRRRLLDSSFAEPLDPDADFTPLLETLAGLPEGVDPLSQLLRLETRHFLADHNLNYLDKMTMAFGVEGRVPLLDLEIVKFAAQVPSKLKVKGTTGKYLLKRAMEPLLPHKILHRPKTGFGVPLRLWMTRDLREISDEVLSYDSIKRRGVFHPDTVLHLKSQTQAGKMDGAYTLFALLSFELWCRDFLDTRAQGARCHGTPSIKRSSTA
jgi:asparagine synthase (glutamine-hydrolysing)